MTSTTKETLDYLFTLRPVKDWSEQEYYTKLMHFATCYGEKGVKGLAGFYAWAIENFRETPKASTRIIRSTYEHDLNNAGRPEFIPRSQSFADFYLKLVES